MIGDDLEAIVGGSVERGEHRFVDDVGDGACVFRRLAGGDIDTGVGHRQVLLGLTTSWTANTSGELPPLF